MDRWLANTPLELEQKASLSYLLISCSSEFVEFLNRLFTPSSHISTFQWPWRRPHVHRQLQQLHCHDHEGGVDPNCANHFFIDVSHGSNHAGYGSDCSSNVSDHVDNASPASLLQREADQQLWPARAIDQIVWPTCSDHLSCCNNDRREERRYDNRNNLHDNILQSLRTRQFCRHRTDFRPKISVLIIFYLFLA